MKRFLSVLVFLALALSGLAQENGAPCTYLYAQKDTNSLFLDIYDPVPGSPTEVDGTPKPGIIYLFGGGFVMGRRDDPSYVPWFHKLAEDGYRVISIDYRLGLRGV